METVNPLAGKKVDKKVNYRKEKRGFFRRVIQIFCSPLLLLVDAFRSRPSPLIIYAFLWFMLGTFLLTATLFFWVEGQETQLERILGGYFSDHEVAIPVSTEIEGIIKRNALMADVSPQLITAVIQVESGFNSSAYSPKGACGLMQISPLVWQAYNPHSSCDGRHRPGGVDHGVDCIYNIEANITTGVHYLRDLIDHFDGEIGRALEAYNAGLTNVNLDKLRPKFRETRNYLQRIGMLLSSDNPERFFTLYYFQCLGRALLRGLFIFTLILWVVFLIWSQRHLRKIL
jgi:hypothetical protein